MEMVKEKEGGEKGKQSRKGDPHIDILSNSRKKINRCSYFVWLRETTERKQGFYLEIIHLTSAHLGR